jgi:hypothetical protein
LEAEFDRSLISALKECASGRWGLVAASGVVFTVQDLHNKMMRVKSTECNQFHNFWLSVGENIGRVKLVGRGTFAQEVFMVTLTLIGLLLSLAQVVISPRRK